MVYLVANMENPRACHNLMYVAHHYAKRLTDLEIKSSDLSFEFGNMEMVRARFGSQSGIEILSILKGTTEAEAAEKTSAAAPPAAVKEDAWILAGG